MKQSLAIIGTGIAGMGAAHFLHKEYDITVYEKNSYIGGHTNTVTVNEEGKEVPIDTGFMVFNNHTYPNLIKLFKQLDVPVMDTDMSFSVQHRPSGLEYCGTSLNHLFAQRKNVLNIPFIKMLMQINRFNKESIAILDKPEFENYSMREFVDKLGFGDDFLYKYLSPMSSALWSTPTDVTLQFPAITLVRFFKNHGFLGLNTQFQWHTVKGGSREYRNRIIKPWADRVLLNNAATKVRRTEDGRVIVTSQDGIERTFDKVIMASHADETLRMLENPTAPELNMLSKFEYQKNYATLHTDEKVMAKAPLAWSSWNYVIDKSEQGQLQPYTVYYMNMLQKISDKKHYFVNINGDHSYDPSKVLKRIEYEHPIFTVPGFKVQADLPKLNQDGPVYFCGSYFKYGFHEDAFTSAVNLCSQLLGRNVWE